MGREGRRERGEEGGRRGREEGSQKWRRERGRGIGRVAYGSIPSLNGCGPL